MDRLQRLGDARFGFGRWNFPFLQAERDIFCHRHVRPQGIALEHHSRAPLVGRKFCHILLVEKNPAGFRGVKSGDAPQEGRLPASARPQKKEQLARMNPETDVVQRDGGTEFFDEILDGDGDHFCGGGVRRGSAGFSSNQAWALRRDSVRASARSGLEM